jgi:site-specific DNA recombinase
MDNSFKVSVYIRVSTGRQASEGDSLEEQEKELKKFCEYKNYLIHKIHIERGKSAKDTNRPEYQKLITDIKEKKINAVVVKKLDRLSRSLLDFEEFMRVAQDKDVEFISLKENFDTTNAMGKAMLRVALVFAQLEREQNSERVSDVMLFRAEQGMFNGGIPPFGYDIINKELVPHKQERKIVELIFEKFIETKSTVLTARELNALGARNRNSLLWDKRRIDYILRNPVYIGKMKWNEQLFPALHQPIITEAKMQLVKEIFAERTYMPSNNKTMGLLRGLLFCGICHTPLGPSYTKKKNGTTYLYYRCGSTFNKTGQETICTGQYVGLDTVHQQVKEKLLLYSTEKELLAMQKKINVSNGEAERQVSFLVADINKLENGLKGIKQKKEQYLDSLIAGQFTTTERERINQKIDEFAISEKQIQATIYKQQFELNSARERIISIEPYKQAIISYRINHESMNDRIWSEWLRKHVRRIIYIKGNVEIVFKNLEFGS